ncbi:uncharacterized protein B0T23DRAFT_389038 [Neurospora hispaniola]|uniref:RRN7-type domain-containing protein n=1 Tax=Neurospora hispaniola TaxID=588809 RepID=A0AAJ0MM81_9PEZI|nr:hypothetical protein B0T23DRAFT_389038 [Neurospora hispaniola]
MDEQRLRKFPNGQRCTECRARKYYSENGRRYCQRGHEVEGYIQFDVDEDDNYGKTGKVVRKEKEVRETERKHLSGNDAKELYLDCLQIILRKQILWLIREKGFSDELESICRDLWDLRIRKFIGLKSVSRVSSLQAKGKGVDHDGTGSQHGGGDGALSQSGSDSEMVMYSSQAETTDTSADESLKSQRRRSSRVKDWESELWDLPGPMEVLALIYMGCLLKQEPVRVGDIYRWAKNNQLPFLGALELVPNELRERLPGWAQRTLLTRWAKFDGSELHKSLLTLTLGFKKNYGMVSPPLPAPSLLVLYLKDLALPPEVHLHARQICLMLNLSWTFPTRQNIKDDASSFTGKTSRYTLLDIPDVLLVASLVLATKYMYPMDGVKRYPRDSNDPLTLKMDWDAWEAEFADPPEKPLRRLDFAAMDAEKVWTLSKEQMVEYLDWYQETQLKSWSAADETEIERLFPLENVLRLPEPGSKDMTDEQLIARMHRVQKSMTLVEPRPETNDGKNIKRLGALHQRFRSVEQLGGSGPARRFHEKAAEISGLSLKALVKAVYSLEELLYGWEKREKRKMRLGEV